MRSPVSLGLVAGRVLGKPLGITLASWAGVRGAANLGVPGASVVAGLVGFTLLGAAPRATAGPAPSR